MAKLNAAESIRGLACLAVVFSHLSLSFYPYLHHFSPDDRAHGSWDYFIHHSPFAFWYSGTAAVFVFFVLSGFVLSYAILAPSAHNLQSWKIQMSGNDSILLFCDTTRLLPQTDPLNRQIMLTQGTFLEFFKIICMSYAITMTRSL